MNVSCASFHSLNQSNQEPSLYSCVAAFRVSYPSSCPSPVTWGCYSVLAMSILGLATLVLVLSLSWTQVIREGSMWVRAIYVCTLSEAALYVVRYAFVPNDLIVFVATIIEAEVIVVAAYILAWICVELHTTPSKEWMYTRTVYCLLQPMLVALAVALVVTLMLIFVGVLGNSKDCHQLAWLLISFFRAVCVVVCAVAAKLIQQQMNKVAVSEDYRKSKTMLIGWVAAILIVATVVELSNDAWAVFDPQQGGCWKWSSVSIDVSAYGDGTPMLMLRVVTRALKFYLPICAVVIFFRALMPERQLRTRAMSWVSHIGSLGGGGGDEDRDDWSMISGYEPTAAMGEHLLQNVDDDDMYVRSERRRKSGGAAVVGVVDHGGYEEEEEEDGQRLKPSDLFVHDGSKGSMNRRDLLRESVQYK